ncbi:MAG: hypothetical protein IPO37_19115 [Saprospiraceae bacterium]|nr:hypothetical protein [Saprospiraceae bacterium]
MRKKVQIIEYIKDQKFPSNFNEKPDQDTGLIFKWFKIGETRENKLLKQGAKIVLSIIMAINGN